MERRRLLVIVASYMAMLTVGYVVGTTMISSTGAEHSGLDRVALHYSNLASEQIPLTVDEATESGWTGSPYCISGRGRFYQKLLGSGLYPLMLLYNPDDSLIGISLHSETVQPSPPWEYIPDGLRGIGVPNVESAHWRTSFYVIDPVRACGYKYKEAACPICNAR